MLRGRRRDLTKVIVFVSLAILSIVLTIGAAGIVSLSYVTRVGVHSLLAFWASIPAAVIILELQQRYSLSKMLFGTSFIFTMLIHVASALRNLLQFGAESIEVTTVDSVSTLIELATIGTLFVLSLLFRYLHDGEFTRQRRWASAIVIIGSPVIFYILCSNLILPFFSPEMLVAGGITACLIATLTFVIVPFIGYRRPEKSIPLDLGYITSASILMILSAVLVLSALIENSDIWVYAENTQIAGLLLFGFATAIPFLKSSGFSRASRYGVVSVLALSTYLPLLVTTIIETLSIDVLFENTLAFGIIHIGTCCLAAMMAALLYAYSRIRPSGIQYPLILLFTLWAGVFFASILPMFWPEYGEQLSPYLAGSIITLILLRDVEKWSSSALAERAIPSTRTILVRVLLILTVISVVEILNLQVLLRFGEFEWTVIGNSVLLASTSILMLGFAYMIFLLARRGHGSLSFETYVVAFLSLWIVPVTLKSFYLQWSAGWWLSEILLFIGMLIGPAVLGFLYIRVMREADRSYTRARLFAGLLMHDITNYNQVTLTTLELLGSGELPQGRIESLVADAKRAVSMAEGLVENVRLLSSGDSLSTDVLKKVDLVSMTVQAMDSVARNEDGVVPVMNFQPAAEHAFVTGNSLLLGALVNLVYAALELSSIGDEILLKLDYNRGLGQSWWEIEIVVPTALDSLGDAVLQDSDMLPGETRVNLRFQVAEMVAEQLGGFSSMKIKRGDSLDRGVRFTLALPAWDE